MAKTSLKTLNRMFRLSVMIIASPQSHLNHQNRMGLKISQAAVFLHNL